MGAEAAPPDGSLCSRRRMASPGGSKRERIASERQAFGRRIGGDHLLGRHHDHDPMKQADSDLDRVGPVCLAPVRDANHGSNATVRTIDLETQTHRQIAISWWHLSLSHRSIRADRCGSAIYDRLPHLHPFAVWLRSRGGISACPSVHPSGQVRIRDLRSTAPSPSFRRVANAGTRRFEHLQRSVRHLAILDHRG